MITPEHVAAHPAKFNLMRDPSDREIAEAKLALQRADSVSEQRYSLASVAELVLGQPNESYRERYAQLDEWRGKPFDPFDPYDEIGGEA